MPIAGLTALRALRQGGFLLGREVLVTGATGGVGQFAVQLARAAGARVTAQVSGPERAEEARAAGAHAVAWDLEADDLGPYALVADGIGGAVLAAAIGLLEPGGVAVTYGAAGGMAELGLPSFAGAPNARLVGLFHNVPEDEKGADLAILAGQVAARSARTAPRRRRGLDRHGGGARRPQGSARIRGKAVLRRT